jgi:hypothetical protein
MPLDRQEPGTKRAGLSAVWDGKGAHEHNHLHKHLPDAFDALCVACALAFVAAVLIGAL